MLWQFQMGVGVNWQIYPKSANFELTCSFMLCFTEGLFVLHMKDLISAYNPRQEKESSTAIVLHNNITAESE